MFGLVILFGVAVSISLVWLGGVWLYVSTNAGLDSVMSMHPSDLAAFIGSAFAPVGAFWLIIGFIYSGFVIKKQSRYMQLLLTQARRSSDNTETMIQALLEMQQQTKSAMALHNVDLIVRDLNELLAEIGVRFGLITTDNVTTLWQRVGNGNVWAFCKVILNNADMKKSFEVSLRHQADRDPSLANALSEFRYRFERLIKLLDEYDTDRLASDIIEDGLMGRVYTRLMTALESEDVPSRMSWPDTVEEPVENTRAVGKTETEEYKEESRIGFFDTMVPEEDILDLPKEEEKTLVINNTLADEDDVDSIPSFFEEKEEPVLMEEEEQEARPYVDVMLDTVEIPPLKPPGSDAKENSGVWGGEPRISLRADVKQ